MNRMTWEQRYKAEKKGSRYGGSRLSKFMTEKLWVDPPGEISRGMRRRRRRFGIRSGAYVHLLYRSFDGYKPRIFHNHGGQNKTKTYNNR